MSTTLRYIFVNSPHIKNIQHEYTLNTTCKDVKRQLYTSWPNELGTVDYNKIRLIIGGQSMDDTKMLSEYYVCTPNSTPAVHVAVLPVDSTYDNKSQIQQTNKQASCCIIQ